MPWEKVTTRSGHTYTDWRSPLPRIPDVMTRAVIYLFDDVLGAETGVSLGGSGFVATVFSEMDGRRIRHDYAVTNAHVVEDGFCVVRVNLNEPVAGRKADCFDFARKSWVTHPVHDLAVRPLPPDLDHSRLNMTGLTLQYFLSPEQCIQDQVGPGDDLVYVGRFMDHAGRYENLPSVRFGNISMMPNESEPVEYEVNGTKRSQVGFLVESRSRAGYSGSPVFLLQQREAPGTRFVFAHKDLRLLGVDWGHLLEDVPLRDPSGHFHGQSFKVQVHAGMMGVVPAWYLKEFLESSQFIEQRRKDVEWHLAHPPTAASE